MAHNTTISNPESIGEPAPTRWSHWGEDVLFGGPVFNHISRTYNICFPYIDSFNSFLMVQPADLRGNEYLPLVKHHLPTLNELQKAVARIAIFDSAAAFQQRKFPSTFLSGFFFTSTRFVTRTHLFGSEGPLTPRICLASEAPDSSIHEFPCAWREAKVLHWDLNEDIAVFELVDGAVDRTIPLVVEDIKIKNKDVVVIIGYNGEISESQLSTFFNLLPPLEKPPYLLNFRVANTNVFYADRKSLSPGLVTVVSQDVQDNRPVPDGLFATSCTVSGGSSGAPIFLIREGSSPLLIGSVLGGKMIHNYNQATRFSPKHIQIANANYNV